MSHPRCGFDMTAATRGALWFVVLNPVSGRGRGWRDRERIVAALRAQRLEVELAVSERAGHVQSLVAQALAGGHRNVLAVGGDGTVHEAANAVLEARADVRFAALPVGTGNDFARTHGLPRDYAAAARALAACDARAIDVGEARFDDGRRRFFVNVAGVGFDAYVIERMTDRRWGRAAYLAGVLRGLAGYRPQPMRLVVDGQRRDARLFVAFACLGRYCGGGMLVAPEAVGDDGRFDLVQIGDLTRLDVVLSLRRLFDGTIGAHPKVHTARAAAIRIETPLAIEADGELIGRGPVTLAVVRRALRVAAAPAEGGKRAGPL
jgi:YegS/Rv2252/BmrU family lipid kinase